MAISTNQKEFFASRFGDSNRCMCLAGLTYSYLDTAVPPVQYNNIAGGTLDIWTGFALGLFQWVDMVSPARARVTAADVESIGTPSFGDYNAFRTLCTSPAYCYGCLWTDITDCFGNGCYWYNGVCHSSPPTTCSELGAGDCAYYGEGGYYNLDCVLFNGICYVYDSLPPDYWQNSADCTAHGYYWYNNDCYGTLPSCPQLNNPADCTQYGCSWWNSSCNSAPPTNGEQINNQTDCLLFYFHWYGVPASCHTNDQNSLCYYIDSIGGPGGMTSLVIITQIVPMFGNGEITSLQVLGCVQYFGGYDGDSQTGCNYY